MPVWCNWLLIGKPDSGEYQSMSNDWTARLGPRLARLFEWHPPIAHVDYHDRDAERIARELELIRLRFPHHS